MELGGELWEGILGATSGSQFGWAHCGATIWWWIIHGANCIIDSRFFEDKRKTFG